MRRLWRIFGRREAEIADEIAFHLEELTAEYRRRGMGEEEAGRAAQRAMGRVTRVMENYRDAVAIPVLPEIWQDLRYGWRGLRKAPGFTVTAILVLASSIGFTTGLFSIVNGVSFRPLDLPEAEQLAGMSGGRDRGAVHRRIPHALFRAMRESLAGPVELAAADFDHGFRLRVVTGSDARPVSGAVVSDNYFSVLRARAEMGNAEADGVVISHALWRTQLGESRSVIGTPILLDGIQQTVVGVMPERFQGTDIRRPGLWVRETGLPSTHRSERSVLVTARLAPGMTPAVAEATLSALAGRLPQTVPANEVIRTIALRPAVLFPINEELAPFVLLLLFPALLVLTIACANLANLQLARAAIRGTEIATRLSLGASRGRVVRQLLTESLLLAGLGGLAGTIAAWRMLTFLGDYLRTQMVNMTVPEMPLDGRVLGFAIGIVCLTAVACGLAPALRASGEDLAGMTREGRGMGGPGGARMRNWLMATQLTVCTFLLFGAGLMIRSFQAATTTEPGFRSQGTIVARMHLEGKGLNAEAVERLRVQTGTAGPVRGVSAVSGPPLSDRPALPVFVTSGGESRYGLVSPFNRVSPEYFQNLGIGIVAGRTFETAEVLMDAEVAIISQGMAQRLWPGESPIGKRFRMGTDPAAKGREVVGVVRDTRSVWLSRVDESYVYLPFTSSDTGTQALTLLVQLDRDTPEAREQVLRAMRTQEPAANVDMEALDDIVGRWRLLPLAGSTLATALGLFGLALAGVGMHGVMSYVVSQRTREFGIRLALGARKRDVVLLVLQQGLRVTGSGLGAGLVMAVAAGQLIEGSFYGVSALDPYVLLGVGGFLGIASLSSMYRPASRAAAVDPSISLRWE